MNKRISFDKDTSWEQEIGVKQINFRFNIITILVYAIGIILIAQLFNLQIVHGEGYRQQSNTRLSRISKIDSVRGSITDRSGVELAGIRTVNNVEIYKTNVSDEELNTAILKLVNLLNEQQEKYSDTFPIKISPFEYTISDETLEKWKKKYKISENATPEEAFYKFKSKYQISTENIEDIRKIISIRYLITTTGYSATKPITISKDVNDIVVAQINERNGEFPGINIETTSERVYNKGTLAAHVVGYTRTISDEEYQQRKSTYDMDDIIGKTGIESMFEEYLKGTSGKKQVEMSVDGTITGENVTQEAIAGSNIMLTIDSTLQEVTQEALANCVEKIKNGGFSKQYDAKGGAAVVMNVNNGEILAMASYPSYEPQWFVGKLESDKWNYMNDSETHPLLNKAIQGTYEPGSVYKMITAIAGLETGNITAREKINDTGIYTKYNPPRKCWYYTSYHRGHGYLNVTQALQHSCNYFFYELGDRMGIDAIAKYALHFGLGKLTGIELPSEKTGTLAQRKDGWGPGDTLSAAIGQGDNSFTPIQIAKYISSIANGGNVVQPTIVKTILNSDGTEVSQEEIRNFVNNKIGITEQDDGIEISAENIEIAKEGMRMATSESGGTAYNIFKNFIVEVAGKTGSAETAQSNIVNAWFVCFAPYDNPEVAIAVMIENGGHGNYVAEVARDILTQYFGMNETEEISENLTAIPYVEQIR